MAHTYDPYTAYYLSQAGSGVSHVYSGANYQKGHGLGSFLSGIFRSVFPLLKSGARSLGNEFLRTGGNIMHDIALQKAPRESFRKRVHEAGDNITKNLDAGIKNLVGSGYKRPKLVNRRQLQASTRKKTTQARKTPVKKRTRRKTVKTRDIFSV